MGESGRNWYRKLLKILHSVLNSLGMIQLASCAVVVFVTVVECEEQLFGLDSILK